MINVYAIFHLNLAYSSIEKEERAEVIRKCYWPLLNIIEKHNIPLGIELSGWTIREIDKIDPDWLNAFRTLLQAGCCELIGSGYCQAIGPLIPDNLNIYNQQRGLEIYKELLGIKPSIALINEMAFSPELIPIYKQCGYDAIIMERDNISYALGNTASDNNDLPNIVHALNESTMRMLWADSILFQKLQRYVHNEITLTEYENYLSARCNKSLAPLPLYCNDAEIFDYRAGRFDTEPSINSHGEWMRLEEIFVNINSKPGFTWVSPSHALKVTKQDVSCQSLQMNSLRQPIPVKKQLKYNISRWAVSGRDDTWLNTICFRLYSVIKNNENYKQFKDQLCELWKSDYRTHITERRWKRMLNNVTSMANELNISLDCKIKPFTGQPMSEMTQLKNTGFSVIEDDGLLIIKTKTLNLSLNLRRGLSVQAMSFQQNGFTPLLGTLPQGYFDTIELGADYYCNNVTVELTKEHRRITDLVPVEPALHLHNQELVISCSVNTDLGCIEKHYILAPEKQEVKMVISFPEWERPHGTVRINGVTLLPHAYKEKVYVEWPVNTEDTQRYSLTETCFHDNPVSNIVSCTTGFGMKYGRIMFGDNKKSLKVSWDPAQCAAFPMLHHNHQVSDSLTRLIFSLSETDETFVAGGRLPAFQYSISPMPE